MSTRQNKFFWFGVVFCLMISVPARAVLPDAYFQLIPDSSNEQRNENIRSRQEVGGVGDYFKLVKAQGFLKQKQFSSAITLAQTVQTPILLFWKNVVMAEAYLAQGQGGEAYKQLAELPKQPRYSLSFDEGIYKELVKRALLTRFLAQGVASKDRAETLSALLSWFPGDEDVKKILSPEDLSAPLPPAYVVQRLHVLYERNRLKDIRETTSVIDVRSANLSPNELCQSLFELGSALRGDDARKGEAAPILTDVVNGSCGDDLTPRALYRLGQIKPIAGEDRRSFFLDRLAKDYPQHRLTDDAFYLLYKIADEQNDEALKKIYLNKLMALPQGDMKCALTFELGFEAYQKKIFNESALIFNRALGTQAGNDEAVPQVYYWYARSLENLGDQASKLEAKKTYTKIVKEFPFSFYATLASKRSGVLLTIPRLSPFVATTTPPEDVDAVVLVDDLVRQNFFDEARNVLDMAVYANPHWEKMYPDFLAQKAYESQNYRLAIALASKKFGDAVFGPVTNSVDPILSVLYPRAFDDLIQKNAKAVDLPRGVIQGLMREETLFQRSAKSWVGAIGLMQLMPSTAVIVKKTHGLESINPDLTDEEVNILLGSVYLKDMVDKFDGKIPYAIMAYNAGPGNVSKWLKRHPNLELDEFIELVPLSETRNYVKRVMRTAAVYCAMHGEKCF